MVNRAFSECHPGVSFLFFVGAIGFGVVVQHPAYIFASVVCGCLYYVLLYGQGSWKRLLAFLPLPALTALLNPLINHSGKYILFHVFGKAYTYEAFCYGLALGGIFLVMMIWFGCYSAVLTSDKFTALFGSLIPSLSLLLVMILRLIPGFTRKAKQIVDARQSIGKGTSQSAAMGEKLRSGATVLSALTTWALEGSIITADSMRSRGYGSGKRTSFRLYRVSPRDIVLLCVMAALCACVLIAGGTEAQFTPAIKISPLTWGYSAYWLYLLIPVLYELKEAVQWQISISKI